MTFAQVAANLREYANAKNIDNEIMKWLKKNDQFILEAQRKQLFEESIGADGIPLGFYGYNTVKYDKSKKLGMQFTMVSSGTFERGLFVKVNSKNIVVGSNPASHVAKMQQNKNFDTVDFFGLTPQNLGFLKRRLTNYIGEWTANGIAGKGK